MEIKLEIENLSRRAEVFLSEVDRIMDMGKDGKSTLESHGMRKFHECVEVLAHLWRPADHDLVSRRCGDYGLEMKGHFTCSDPSCVIVGFHFWTLQFGSQDRTYHPERVLAAPGSDSEQVFETMLRAIAETKIIGKSACREDWREVRKGVLQLAEWWRKRGKVFAN